ncbi:tRNA-2'-O-ribose methyltransferase [Theileria orientalis strain Shintoku]|uniref:tRNA-2'-O-ribose methyltransferase n=1 Tax=Theileria orientalis strain Shintoku TaxID=869250 RepID=J4D643_THEOR|nr:tRNA-2'-O-ribose methyltransferase [Theileria orientalis strain Shintoku]PVC54791.1 tRNA-2'-O-ribose methyltransferase [Theileria orientalis]BAM39325.1 tRNA-2'-O-ribose methyltransferase [Theileria orientalis strain Shintoku]|eukprot:XP_009689626.1 tRNA-2'-O-ribose methyltransferase [Theileria orientalis strain Shintoku]
MAHTTKENRDIYYRKAKEQGFRARSAYKLLQIFESFHIIYPILDERAALSMLLNSLCADCEQESVNSGLRGSSDSKREDYADTLEDSNGSPGKDANEEVHRGEELKLTDHDKVRRNCHNLGRVKNVVDLCSAPGSWSQLLRNLVYHDYNTLKSACEKLQAQASDKCSGSKAAGGAPSDVKTRRLCKKLLEYVNVMPAIVAIDLQQMAPLEGVHFLRGDITDPKVLSQVQSLFVENVARNVSDVFEGGIPEELKRNAQLITCDGAPDVSGLHETDSFLQSALIRSALSVCYSLLDTDGAFVCKAFFGSRDAPMFREVSSFFDYCTIFKPPSSRPNSFEHFIVALGFKPLGHMPIALSENGAASAVTHELTTLNG